MFGERIVVEGLGDITADVDEALLEILQSDEARMEMQHREIAVKHHGRVERIGKEGTRVAMRVPSYAYHYWRKREGKDVWSDSFHEKFMRREHPELFPKSTTGNIVVGVNGLKCQPLTGVFSKRGKGRWARPT